MQQLIIEALVVGAVLVAVYYALAYLTGESHKLTMKCLVTLFLSGVLVHFGFEYAGWNKWYCKHGHACK